MTITKEDVVRGLMTRIDIDRPKGKSLVESVLKLVKDSLSSFCSMKNSIIQIDLYTILTTV